MSSNKLSKKKDRSGSCRSGPRSQLTSLLEPQSYRLVPEEPPKVPGLLSMLPAPEPQEVDPPSVPQVGLEGGTDPPRVPVGGRLSRPDGLLLPSPDDPELPDPKLPEPEPR